MRSMRPTGSSIAVTSEITRARHRWRRPVVGSEVRSPCARAGSTEESTATGGTWVFSYSGEGVGVLRDACCWSFANGGLPVVDELSPPAAPPDHHHRVDRSASSRSRVRYEKVGADAGTESRRQGSQRRPCRTAAMPSRSTMRRKCSHHHCGRRGVPPWLSVSVTGLPHRAAR
jgi:hypothetical protein